MHTILTLLGRFGLAWDGCFLCWLNHPAAPTHLFSVAWNFLPLIWLILWYHLLLKTTWIFLFYIPKNILKCGVDMSLMVTFPDITVLIMPKKFTTLKSFGWERVKNKTKCLIDAIKSYDALIKMQWDWSWKSAKVSSKSDTNRQIDKLIIRVH